VSIKGLDIFFPNLSYLVQGTFSFPIYYGNVSTYIIYTRFRYYIINYVIKSYIMLNTKELQVVKNTDYYDPGCEAN
jgi:hypothetical protein